MTSIQEAASVLLTRGPDFSDVFVVKRAESLRFFGGFIAFPGGKVHTEDAAVDTIGAACAPDQPLPEGRLVAAARELFEETGVLVARHADGSFPLAGERLTEARKRLLDDERRFGAELRELEVRIHADDFTPLGSVTTPPFVTLRFDTTFLLASLPPGQAAEVWPGELASGEWIRPAELLTRWRRGDCLVSPPTVMTLEMAAGGIVGETPRRLGSLLRSLHDGAIHPIFFAPDVQLIPLDTQSLPPSTYTNAYLVGRDPCYLIDPGTALPEEQARLFRLLDAEAARGRRLSAIVLTHHHPDHIGAVAACSARYGVPVWSHPWTAQALQGKVAVAHQIHDGDRLDLGTAPDGHSPWFLEAIHTPGHAPGHLAFHEAHYRLLFAGDMVSTLSSVVIAPPEGDLTVYLQSLERLKTYDSRLLLPAHGGASSRAITTIDECIAHRAKREDQLLAALSTSPRSVEDLAADLYQGLPSVVMRFAELQVLAGLQKLQREGRAVSGGGRWFQAGALGSQC